LLLVPRKFPRQFFTMANFIRRLQAIILPRRDPIILPRRDRISILRIPDELLLLIFNNLETVDQACLALSCRTLYHKIGPLVLDHPVLSAAGDPHRKSRRRSPRSELLYRLEKDHHEHWIHCAACYTLHPPSEFTDGYNPHDYSLEY